MIFEKRHSEIFEIMACSCFVFRNKENDANSSKHMIIQKYIEKKCSWNKTIDFGSIRSQVFFSLFLFVLKKQITRIHIGIEWSVNHTANRQDK